MNPYPPPPEWARELRSVGVTGTNGKSSTTVWLSAALASAGAPVARACTVDSALLEDGQSERLPPPSTHGEFLALMQRVQARGGGFAAVEATSATLAIGFARAWPFEVAVFTNLGHDHQRTHGSFEAYLAAKAQLFVALPPTGAAVLNAGDPCSNLIAEVLPRAARALWFAGPGAALDRPVDLRVRQALPSSSGLTLELESSERVGPVPASIQLQTLAPFQAPNAAAALLAALALGLPADAAAAGICACEPPAGRFQLAAPIRPHQPTVVVDYAHAPEALRAALASARALHPRRVILVIGAGGDADPSKREPLGREASRADHVFVTNDNPRNEDPAQIAAQICRGLEPDTSVEVVLDRRRAIEAAIACAGPEDLVLIAGKGHETRQSFAGSELPFDDRQVAARALETSVTDNLG